MSTIELADAIARARGAALRAVGHVGSANYAGREAEARQWVRDAFDALDAAAAAALASPAAEPVQALTNRQIIERVERATGVRWLPPFDDDDSGSPGSFDMLTMDQMRRLLASPPATKEAKADDVLRALDDLGDDAAVHIWPDDLEKCSRSACAVEVYSVRYGSPDGETVPLFSREQVAQALRVAPEGAA